MPMGYNYLYLYSFNEVGLRCFLPPKNWTSFFCLFIFLSLLSVFDILTEERLHALKMFGVTMDILYFCCFHSVCFFNRTMLRCNVLNPNLLCCLWALLTKKWNAFQYSGNILFFCCSLDQNIVLFPLNVIRMFTWLFELYVMQTSNPQLFIMIRNQML